MQAQCELNFAWVYQFHNGGLVEDGQFGPATRTATKQFQTCAGLAADGIIGPNTWRSLNSWVASGRSCKVQVTLPQ
jgi:lysozyme